MNAAEHHAELEALVARVKEVCRLGDPLPAVSTDVAGLVVALVVELERTVSDLESCEARL